MLSIYIELVHKILTNVPAIRWVDIDQGQVDDLESFDSILPPAVLIGGLDLEVFENAETNEGTAQELRGRFTVKTIVSLLNDTHLTSVNDMDRFVAKLKTLEVAQAVKEALETLPDVARLSRKEYHFNPKKGVSFYVIEQQFRIIANDATEPTGEWVEFPDRFIIKLEPRICHGNP
jgi:hypothetical protein